MKNLSLLFLLSTLISTTSFADDSKKPDIKPVIDKSEKEKKGLIISPAKQHKQKELIAKPCKNKKVK